MGIFENVVCSSFVLKKITEKNSETQLKCCQGHAEQSGGRYNPNLRATQEDLQGEDVGQSES